MKSGNFIFIMKLRVFRSMFLRPWVPTSYIVSKFFLPIWCFISRPCHSFFSTVSFSESHKTLINRILFVNDNKRTRFLWNSSFPFFGQSGHRAHTWPEGPKNPPYVFEKSFQKTTYSIPFLICEYPRIFGISCPVWNKFPESR